MPAIPLIAVGISSAATAYAAHKAASASTTAAKTQSDAASHAADTELQANREALDWTKKVYNREGEQQAPYVGAGGKAASTLSQLLGLGTPAPWTPISESSPQTDPNHIAPGQPFAASMVPGNPMNAMVTVVAPTGEEKQVPQSEVGHWTKLGAIVKPTSAPPQMGGGAGRDLSHGLMV